MEVIGLVIFMPALWQEKGKVNHEESDWSCGLPDRVWVVGDLYQRQRVLVWTDGGSVAVPD